MIVIAVLAAGASSKLKLKRQKVLERRGKAAGKMAKVGKPKMWGHAMALLFFLGDARLKQWQRGSRVQGQEFGTGEVAALLLSHLWHS